jgi:hypothetical protein
LLIVIYLFFIVPLQHYKEKTKQRSARIKQKSGKQILRKSRIMHNAGRRSYFKSFPSFFDPNHKSNKEKKKIIKTIKKQKKTKDQSGINHHANMITGRNKKLHFYKFLINVG